MKEKQPTIVIETESIWIVKRKRIFIRSFCLECNREVCLIPPREAALLSFCDLDTVYSFMENRCVHIKYFNDKPLICLNSLCSI